MFCFALTTRKCNHTFIVACLSDEEPVFPQDLGFRVFKNGILELEEPDLDSLPKKTKEKDI